ncbi:MAG: glycoside hydrolase family 9 protein, partial [Ruminococcus sp.]|nr:glycoside hydrolase family 9 protein [Ruminococcus sp.]
MINLKKKIVSLLSAMAMTMSILPSLPVSMFENAMTVSAASTVVWQGSATAYGWSSVALSGISNIPDAAAGGKLIFEASGSELQVAAPNGDTWRELNNGTPYAISGGRVTISLTSTDAQYLRSSTGINVNGDGVTVTKVTYVSPESSSTPSGSSGGSAGTLTGSGVVWEGSATPYGWSSIELSGAKIPAAVEGGILTIDATGSSQVQIGAPCGDVWTQLSSPDGNDAFDISGGKVRIVLSASNAQKIRNATALHVNGDGITVTKITYTEPSQESSSQGGNVTPPPSTGSYVVWQGTARPYGWSSVELTGDVTIPTNAEANGYLVINATGSSQVQIGAPAGDAWTQLSSPDGNDAFDITSGKVEIKLSSANAQKLRNATALHVNGDGITVTKITYYPAGTYTPTITSKPDSSSWGGGNNNSSSSKPDTPPVIPEPEGDVGTSEIGQSDFNDGKGLPWHICESMTGKMLFDISGGTYNLTIVNPGGTGNGGEDRWDCQFRHRGLTIEAYHKYRITYSLKTTKAGHIYAKLGSVVNPETVEFWHGDGKVLNMPTLPTTATKAEIESALINAAPTGETIDYGMGYENWKTVLIPANKWVTFAYEFIPTETEVGTCEFTFHMGGKGQYTPTECFPAGTEIQFDNMSLIDLTDSKTNWPIEEPYVRNGVLVNQVGYIAGLSKKATLIVDEGDMTPKTFKVIDATTGKTVYTGKSVPFGADKDSGDFVHTLDFSDLNTVKVVANQGNKDTGAYYITCDGKKSYKFNIGEKTSSATNPMYDGLLTDALNFFYQQRSSGPILSKYITSGDKTKLSRDVGFENDIAYIQDEWIASYPSEDAVITDRGTLDCTGGWFDAGDHGKYVVNGGISVWTLQNMYERELIVNGDASKFADGTMSIPENNNGLPDLLDEVRYQMDFMMKMQRTDGLVYHKMHDYKWTGLAVKPEDDPYTRIVKPVTTAATLNLAATAAQTARLWKGIDDAYATKCLNAAKKAYAAAKANPDLLAPVDQSIGGGPYGDTFVDDDFYWAACELYATTGDKAYHTDLKTYVNPDGHSNDRAFCITPTLASGENIDSKTTFTWGSTANLGTLSLLLNKSVLSSTELNSIKSTLMEAADLYLKIESEQGNGIPYLSTIFYDTFNCPDMEFYGYEWGSNSMVVNNAITMAYAADFATDSNKYANGVVTAMDYIFGRNAGEYSYVTGYGDHTTQYVHHRFWSGQLDGSLPFAPDGVLSGGCNSAMQDPWIKGAGYKVNEYPPQLCYLDHVEAWSVNECTINWNSPLAWVVNYLEDYDAGEVQPTPPVVDPGPESSIPDDSSEIEVTGDPALASISITLTGMIGANVSYFIPSKYINNSDYTIETIFQDTDSGAKVTVPFNANNYVIENGKKAYVFTLPIKPCNMQKDYMARLYIKNAADGSNTTNVLRTSVVLANYVNAYVSSADPLKKAFGKALQTYGYYAQKQFNSADELPNITPLDLRDVTASTVADYQSDVRLYRGTKKAELSQTTLYLDSGTSIRTYLTDIASTVNTNNLYMKYTVDGVAEKVKVKKTSAGDYYGE